MEPLTNREADTSVFTWKKCHDRLTKNGKTVKHYILDNECSENFKDALKKDGVTYQLVPSYQHRRNAAERAIRTFKKHFLAGLATCDQDFPLREWDWLLAQCKITLNLLRNARLNPKLSTWAYLFGNHDFNKVTLFSLGVKIILYMKPGKPTSWAFHGEIGWYAGPATQHYRYITCYIPATQK